MQRNEPSGAGDRERDIGEKGEETEEEEERQAKQKPLHKYRCEAPTTTAAEQQKEYQTNW